MVFETDLIHYPDRRLPQLLSMLERTARAKEASPLVIAIDGRAASGKSTLAKQLASALDCDIVQMDDFFLPPALRTGDRFRTPGGNVHYERFLEEVIPNVGNENGFAYRVFDCGRMDYSGEKVIARKTHLIVEGSYSHHPALGRYADLTVFLHVDPEEQMRRILLRNGPEKAEMFRNRWIPLEEAYFSYYGIPEKADLRL